MIPQSEVELSGEDLETFEKLYSVLEDDEERTKNLHKRRWILITRTDCSESHKLRKRIAS